MYSFPTADLGATGRPLTQRQDSGATAHLQDLTLYSRASTIVDSMGGRASTIVDAMGGRASNKVIITLWDSAKARPWESSYKKWPARTAGL